MNGVQGLINCEYEEITEGAYAPYRNLGGYEILGTVSDLTIKEDNHKDIIDVCEKLDLTALVFVGDHHTMN